MSELTCQFRDGITCRYVEFSDGARVIASLDDYPDDDGFIGRASLYDKSGAYVGAAQFSELAAEMDGPSAALCDALESAVDAAYLPYVDCLREALEREEEAVAREAAEKLFA